MRYSIQLSAFDLLLIAFRPMQNYDATSVIVFAIWLIAEIDRSRYDFRSDRHLVFYFFIMQACIVTFAVTLIVQVVRLV